jgi:hypothetical protein
LQAPGESSDGGDEVFDGVKVPRRMAWRVMIPKKIPAMISHEYPVGVMCRVIRRLSGFAGHLRSLGACPSVVVQHGMQPCAGMGGGGPLGEAQDLMVAVPGRCRGRQAFAVAFPVAICRAMTSAASISAGHPDRGSSSSAAIASSSAAIASSSAAIAPCRQRPR